MQISALSLVTTMYVAHKYGYDEVRENLKRVVSFVTVLDLESQTVIDMLSSEWKDYEDATQNHTALLADADCIVTRNKKDFLESTLPVYTVSEFWKKIRFHWGSEGDNFSTKVLYQSQSQGFGDRFSMPR